MSRPAMPGGDPHGHCVRAASATLASAVAYWALPAPAVHLPLLAAALRLPRYAAFEGSVALTFDDGPHPRGTPAVLEALADGQVHATFFLVGEQVRRAPALVREILAAGHAVAVHADRHRNLLRVPPSAARDDIARAAAAIEDATGAAAAPLHRPPYGVYSPPALRAVHERGLTPLLWSRWGRDWRPRATPTSIAADASRSIVSGDVILLHDADHYSAPGSWRRTADALPRLFEAIARRGLTLAPVRSAVDVLRRP